MATIDKDSVNNALKSVQLRKARYALFKVNNGEILQIIVDKVSERKCDYKDLLKELRDDTPRYICYDFEYKSNDGRPTSALYFIYWCPENVNQNDKILYSTGKSNMVAALSGYKLFAIDTDKDDLEEILKSEVVSGK